MSKHSYYYNNVYDGLNCNRVGSASNVYVGRYCYHMETWRAKHRRDLDAIAYRLQTYYGLTMEPSHAVRAIGFNPA